MSVTVGVIVKGRHDHLRRTLHGIAGQSRPADQVVVGTMGDPEAADLVSRIDPAIEIVDVAHRPEEPLPLARARNAVAGREQGDLLVFLDVDCIPHPSLIADYVDAARTGLLMGSVRYLPAGVPAGDTWTLSTLTDRGRPHPARPDVERPQRTDRYDLFWSLNFAVDRRSWDRIGGFDEGYSGYGGEDTDLSFSARRAGVPASFVPGAVAFHQHHPVSDPPVEHLADIVTNARRFRRKWGTWPMEGWLATFRDAGLIRWHGDVLTILEEVPCR